MAQEEALSSEESKELRNRHPLYARLSGDVVWALFEELGYDDEQCGRAMDAVIAQMHHVLAVMRRLESDPTAHFVLRGDPACERCAPLMRAAFPATHPAWRRFLPPFAVGCRMSCEALDAAALKERGYAAPADGESAPPDCPLLCPLLCEGAGEKQGRVVWREG